jgi:hypothetical protein
MENNILENNMKRLKAPLFGAYYNEAFPYNHDEYFNDIFNENKRKHLTNLQSINEKMTDNTKEIVSEMTSLFKEIKTYESNNKDLLIEVLVNYIKERYSLDDDIINIKCHLNDKLKANNNSMEDVILEYEDFDGINQHNGKIKQRLIIDSIINGSSRDYKNFIYENYSKIADINPLLPMKYNKLGSMASFLPYTEDISNLKDGGDFMIDYPKKHEGIIKIECVGVDLLSLFSALNKAILTLLVNNTLQNRKEEDVTTIKESIKNAYQPYLCDHIWGAFKNSLNKINSSSSHFILYEMASMEVSNFNKLMKEILFKTKKSKVLIDEISNKINFKLNQ